jgi:hypothetical protein
MRILKPFSKENIESLFSLINRILMTLLITYIFIIVLFKVDIDNIIIGATQKIIGENNQITQSLQDSYLNSLYSEEEFEKYSKKIPMPLLGESNFSFLRLNRNIADLNISSKQKAELYNYYELLNSFYMNLITDQYRTTNQALNELKEILKKDQCKAFSILKDKLDQVNPRTHLAYSHDFILEPLFGLVRHIIIKTKKLTLKDLEANQEKFQKLIESYSFMLLPYTYFSPICNDEKAMIDYLEISKEFK